LLSKAAIAIELNDFAILTNTDRHECGATGKNRHFAAELPGAQGSHPHATIVAELHTFYCSREHDVEVGDGITALDEHFSRLDRAAFPMLCNARELRVGQYRKRVIRFRNRERLERFERHSHADSVLHNDHARDTLLQ
jgi:hypothetical protein